MKWEDRMNNKRAGLSSSAASVTLSAMLVSVLGFDILLGVDIVDYMMLATVGLALIVLLFYRSRRESWGKTMQ